MPCEVVGRNAKQMTGRLTFFVPEEKASPMCRCRRRCVPLRFDQFQSLTLTTPPRPVALAKSDPHAGAAGARAHSSWALRLAGGAGAPWSRAIGHVGTRLGLFLFPLLQGADDADDDGAQRHAHVRAALGLHTHFEIGSRIGELLVELNSATALQIEQADRAQANMRSAKLGDILVTRQLVSPQQLLDAIGARPRCRWCASAKR